MHYSNLTPTADYRQDCDTGRNLADSLIAQIRQDGFTPALGNVAREMIASGRFGGIEIGFFQRVAESI